MILKHKKIFYIVRHGQTTDNAAGLISGRASNPSLTGLGREQCIHAASVYANLFPKPTRIITSSLIRTHETAALITGHSDFIVEPRMDERGLGELDGKISEEEQLRRKVLPGEERVEEQRARVLDALNHHLAEDEPPLFVCHGGTIRRMLEITGLEGRIKAENGIIYTITPHGDGWKIG